jgi:hypothetical protein
MDGRRSWMIFFLEMRARLQQMLARIEASEEVSEGFIRFD